MVLPLLQTKLFIPSPRSNLVIRPRLEERLNNALEQNFKIVLLSASAGCGKTTLLAGWIKKASSHVAWLSLDEEDNDPVRFWRYLIAALATAHHSLADSVQELLISPQLASPTQLLTILINEIARLPENNRLILVLDDYHLITHQEIHTHLAFFLDHLPPQVLLILSTRRDPPLPINRIRAKGQLVELRAMDLRFEKEEVRALVQSIARLDLQADEIKTLESRTEGWAVGLQMAALSLNGRNDRAEFLNHFSGSHSFILDYLTEEVFSSQPVDIRSFLLRTSILDQMCAGLCSALLQETPNCQSDQVTSDMNMDTSAQNILETLERSNLFVVPLDNSRQWYRYHHLFADLLRARLRQANPAEVLLLHLKASEWYRRNGFPNQAVNHALAGGDAELAANLALEYWKPMAWSGKINTIQIWFETLPRSLIQSNVLLGVAYAWALNLKGRFQDLDPILDDLEKTLGEPALPGKEKDWLTARMSIGPLRVSRAIRQGNYTTALSYAEQALILAPEEQVQERGVAYFFLGNACRAIGDLLAAKQAFSSAKPLLRESGNYTATSAAAYALVSLSILEGDLLTAEKMAMDAFEWIDVVHPQPAAAQTLTAMGEVRYMQNRLDEATEWLERGFSLSTNFGYLEGIRCSAIALARLKCAQGDEARAIAILNEAVLFSKGLQPLLSGIEITAALACVQSRTGDLKSAAEWADQFLKHTPPLAVIPMEIAMLSAARVRLAQGRPDEAIKLLEKVSKQAESGKRITIQVESLILKALIYDLNNDSRALETFHKAIVLALPGNLTRLFLDEGDPLIAMIRKFQTKLQGDDRVRTFAQYLLDYGRLIQADFPKNSELVEPLSSRELEILKFLCQGWSNQQVADHLFISLPTVKKHTGNIFAKLEVTSRTQAIARARDLEFV